jgi:NADPH:quinone reductase
MRAIQVASYNAPLLLTELPAPAPAPDHEVLDVVYASVNPLDIWVSRGNFAGVTPQPHTPGVEGVGRRANGTHVIISGVGIANPGTYAEQVIASPASLVEVPDGVDLQQAAAITVAGITAWMCMHTLGRLGPKDTVLVLGATGGVGAVAVQLARNAGATVIGQTSSATKVAAITALGAQAIVAPTAADLATALNGTAPTLVVEGLGGAFTGACVELVAPAARIVNFGTSSDTAVSFDMRTFYRKGTQLLGYGGLILTAEHRTQAYAALFADIAAGRLTVPIDEVLPLHQAGEAHRRILAKEVSGKLLLDPTL